MSFSQENPHDTEWFGVDLYQNHPYSSGSAVLLPASFIIDFTSFRNQSSKEKLTVEETQQQSCLPTPQFVVVLSQC